MGSDPEFVYTDHTAGSRTTSKLPTLHNPQCTRRKRGDRGLEVGEAEREREVYVNGRRGLG